MAAHKKASAADTPPVTPSVPALTAAERDERLRGGALSRAMPESRLLAGLEGGSGCGIALPSLGSLHLAKDRGRRETVRALERVFTRALESGDAHRRGVMGETTVLSPVWDQDRRAWGRRRVAARRTSGCQRPPSSPARSRRRSPCRRASPSTST
jgi:hypothetical protein